MNATNRYLFFISIVISLVLAGMITPVMVHAETYKPNVSARKHIESGGRSVEYIIARVNAAGFTDVYFIGFEHGDYNIKARHPNGQYVEIQLDPKTGALVMDPVTGKPRYQTVSRIESDKVTQSRKRHLITQAKEAGYKEVSSIEYDHGLYEIIARDAQNRVVELWAKPTGKLIRHPKTGEPLFEYL